MLATFRFLLARAGERSTFAGAGVAVGAIGQLIGYSVSDATVSAAIDAITALAAFLLIVIPTQTVDAQQ